MASSDTSSDIEQRVYQLLGERKLTTEIADELGLSVDDALALALKVLRERGNPNLAGLRQAIEQLEGLRVA